MSFTQVRAARVVKAVLAPVANTCGAVTVIVTAVVVNAAFVTLQKLTMAPSTGVNGILNAEAVGVICADMTTAFCCGVSCSGFGDRTAAFDR